MLRQLKLQVELKQKQNELKSLRASYLAFKTRKADLERALDEATTDEDIELVGNQIDELEGETDDSNIQETISSVLDDIKGIEAELESINKPTETQPQENKKNERGIKMTDYQVRELVKSGEYYERAEVKDFYDKFKNLRAVGGEGLTVPQIVINRISEIVGDYCTMYNLVDKIKVNGTARILIDTDTTAATWTEQSGTVANGDVGTITSIDFDGYKIGKVTFVDNCMLKDSIVNLDDYVCKKIARAIGLGLDLAILKGKGATSKQPEGIIEKLAASHKVTVVNGGLIDIVKPIGLIDTGVDSIGEIVAVMKRSTYYDKLLAYSINTDASGNVVGRLPNLKSVDLLGLRVVFNNNMDDGKILYGDYSKYTLIEREDVAIDKSEHVKFSEDQMGFRGRGRYDGKPTNTNAFVLVTITEKPVA